MKKDLFREVWRQKGTLLREFASRAKLVTPRNFMTESTPTLTPALPSPQTQARRRWQHILRSLTVSPANAQTIEQTPSTSDENTGANPERLTSASPIVPRDVPGARGPFPESAARGDVTRGRVRTLLRKRPPAKDPRG
ncbi:uncharacterized protein EI90DRAFT_3034523 [Cantharellus anzutake]|uniref:uncharacterized protein n=1 Tax=Cantharellus anzutake TaxID=1750568 RepID=UPI0019079CE4|nr:uncharacterized protein EI90DRAFT_3034523 [Cantharellus anzutake]KAF8341582.1 hypothetical protein EI90DRAFT_3034523 [Cantharellus anzutake]